MLRAVVALLAVAVSGAVSAEDIVLPPGMSAHKLGHGWQFREQNGMTLYTFDRDESAPGSSACVDECAVTWPPLLADANAQPVGGWGFVTRKDGAKQWAYKKKPVYTYALDAGPGATFGEGVGSVWRVAFQDIATPAEIGILQTNLGQVLTDAKGRTLYAPDDEKTKVDLKNWKPLLAPWLSNASGDWSVVTRADGSKQWAFQKKALYTYNGDVNPTEIRGDAQPGWSAVVLEPEAPLPPWATVQASDAGELIANKEGRTVYAFAFNPRNRRINPKLLACNGECVDEEWIPFYATENDKPTGVWTIMKRTDGKLQWAHKGNKIFTHILDKQPGDFKGIRFGGDRSWAAIMRSGQPMQGVTVGG